MTRFFDGTMCPSVPHDTAHYAVISHRCGYGDDRLAYCWEHDLAHAVIEEVLHGRPSRVLWALAHGTELTGTEAAYEELAAQCLQRFVRAAERPIVGGVDWDAMRGRMLGLLAS